MTLRQLPYSGRYVLLLVDMLITAASCPASCAFFETVLGFIWINLDVYASKLNY